jgi:alkylation response protein AidB-like acyl-CoA dehydrogenase
MEEVDPEGFTMTVQTSPERPDRSTVRDEVGTWLQEHWDPQIRNRDWMATVVDSGWACPSWPKEWFGKGLTMADSRTVVAAFAAAGAPGAGHDIANLAANVIFAHGSDETKGRFLRGVLVGDLHFCLLYSEPGAGSDLAGIQCRAERDGDEWLVNGQKVWTSGGHTAEYGLLLARTDWDVPKHQGVSYFLFPMRQPGVEVRPIKMITGESHFNEVFLDSARTPNADLLGDVNGGWKVMQTALAYERALMGGAAPQMFPKRRAPTAETAVGSRKRPAATDALGVPDVDLVALARERGVNDDPLIRQHLARLHTLKTLSRWNAVRARAEMRKAYSSPAASIGKLAMSEQLHFSGYVFAEILGAEATLARESSELAGNCVIAMLNAYVNSIGGGTDQIQRNILGERVLGLPKEPEVDRDVAFRDVLKSPATTK